MCDFHSTAWRILGQDIQMLHDAGNSHSGMIQAAGWRENQPQRQTVIFEAEWDGKGDLPSDSRLIRNNGECPERVVKAIRAYYTKLKKVIETGEGLMETFGDFEKFSDVWARVKTLPANVKFPQKISGSLDLIGLTSLPANVKFPQKISGSLDLRGLTSLPANVKFPQKIGGSLYLSGLTSLPANVKFPTECGYLYLSGDLREQLNSRR